MEVDGVPPHDSFFRAVFSDPAACADLVRAALPPDLLATLDLESLAIESGSFITDPLRARFADLLLSIRARGRSVLVHLLVEHKSQPERFTIVDLFDSVAAIWKRFRANHPREESIPRILPIVIHHGPKPWSQPKRLCELFATHDELAAAFASFDPTLPVVFFDLGGIEDPERALETLHNPLAQLCLFLLMTSRSENFVTHLEHAGLRLLRAVWHSPNGPHVCVPVLDYVLRSWPKKLATQELAKMLHDHVAPEAEETFQSAADALIEQGVEQGIERGRAEGEAIGRVQGEAAGRAQGEIVAITKVLTARFGPAAEMLIPRISRCTDDDELLRLVVLAATVKSLDAFARELGDRESH